MNLSYLKTSLYTSVTAAILLSSSQGQAQQYYKWIDKSGSTHYTTTPPPKGAKHLNKVSTYGSQPIPKTSEQQPQAKTDKGVQETTNVTQEKAVPAVAEAPSIPAVSAPR